MNKATNENTMNRTEEVTMNCTDEIVMILFKKYYPNEDTQFLKELSPKDYIQIFDLLINKEGLDAIKSVANRKTRNQKRKKYMNKITYMNEVLLNYALTSDNPKSKTLREFLMKHIVGFVDNDLTVISKPMTKEDIQDNGKLLETLMEGKNTLVGICTQPYHTIDKYLWETYCGYLFTTCCRWTDYYRKTTALIIFTQDNNYKYHHKFIEEQVLDIENNIEFGPVGKGQESLYFVNLQCLEDLFKDYAGYYEVPEFFAAMYYMYYDHVDGIRYENKENIIEIMKELKEEFIEKYLDLCELSLQRKDMKLDRGTIMCRSLKQSRPIPPYEFYSNEVKK